MNQAVPDSVAGRDGKKVLVLGICPARSSGPAKKMLGISDALRRAGLDSRLQRIRTNRFQGARDVANTVNAFEGDLIILRVDYSLIRALPALWRHKRRGGLLTLDVPTPVAVGLRETLREKGLPPLDRLVRLSTLWLMPWPLFMADRIIQYSEEGPYFEFGLGARICRISNAVDVSGIPVAQSPTSGPVRAIAVASMTKSHGLDRLLYGLGAHCRRYSGEPNIRIRIVGSGPETPYLKSLTAEFGVQDWVDFSPNTTGDGLDSLFSEADVAIGALGIHRVGMKSASALKNREYLARGVPVLYSGLDPDLDLAREQGLALRCPANENSIDVSSLVVWALANRLERDMRRRVRSFAESHVDYSQRVGQYIPDGLDWREPEPENPESGS